MLKYMAKNKHSRLWLKQLELNDDKLKKIKEDDDFQAMLQNALEA